MTKRYDTGIPNNYVKVYNSHLLIKDTNIASLIYLYFYSVLMNSLCWFRKGFSQTYFKTRSLINLNKS